MNISSIFYICAFLIGIVGIRIFYKNFYCSGREYIRFKKLWKMELMSELKRHSLLFKRISIINDELFFKLFNFIRYTLFIIAMVYLVLNKELTLLKGIALLIVFILIKPVKELFGKETFYGKIFLFRKNMQMKKIDIDLFYAMSRLKNLCCSQNNNSINGSYLIEMLLRDSGCTHNAFSKLLFIWRLGRKQEACAMFAENLNTKMAYEFSKILLKLDDLKPDDMVARIDSYQNHIREKRMTENLKRQEVISYILYLPIMASAFCIMLNFLVVVVVMDTMKMLQNL